MWASRILRQFLVVCAMWGGALAWGPVLSARAESSERAPLYRIAGYKERQEYVESESEWRQILGPAGYRQKVASGALLAVGGLSAFGGATALLATLFSLADNSGYGQMALPGAADAYRSYIYGFSGMLAVGGALICTGLVLSLPLPSRRRPILIPRLSAVGESARPSKPEGGGGT